MTDPAHALPAVSEQDLMPLTDPGHGWSAERARLSAAAVAEIEGLLGNHLAPVQIERLLPYVKHIFANAVALALAECQLIDAAEEKADVRGQPNRPPRKLGVKLRDDLRRLEARLDEGAMGADLCREIVRDPVLERLITPYLEERMGWTVPNPLTRAPDKAAGYLPPVLTALEQAITQGITPGRTEAALTVLCRGFCGFYRDVAGQLPSRTYDPINRRDTGHGLEACRILGRELNAALPPAHRRRNAPDMTKPYRRALEELRAEG